LQRLVAEDLDQFYAQLFVDGRPTGDRGSQSVNTVRHIHTPPRLAELYDE
jgi:hypothetical protein